MRRCEAFTGQVLSKATREYYTPSALHAPLSQPVGISLSSKRVKVVKLGRVDISRCI